MTLVKSLLANEMFLQGKYISIGLNSTGTLGTRNIAPSGIYTNIDIGFNRVGLWADFDGFGTGKASTVQEAVLKGTGVEGFSIGYKSGNSQVVRTNHERSGLITFTGTTKDLSTSGVAASGWTGTTAEKVKIDQVTSLTDDAKFVKMTVTVTNQSSSPLSDVRYMRTVDPDQGGGFNTVNTILEQQSGKGALVAAYNGTISPLFLYARDARAVVSTFGFENTNPYVDAAYAKPQNVGYSIKGDYAINIDFALGTLGSSQSTTLTFYIGLTDNLDATIAQIDKGVVTVPTSPSTPVPVNAAPLAVGDAFSGQAGKAITGDILANDKDADGDTLIVAVESGPLNGTLDLNVDGSFRYTPKTGFSGSDSFTYTASDGVATSSATVKLTVAAAPPTTIPKPAPGPVLPDDAVLNRSGTVDGSASANQILTGPTHHNSFFVDSAAASGNDRVTNFGSEDVLVTTFAVRGQNADGLVSLTKTRVELDAVGGSDAIRLTGVSELRLLGRSETGLYVYADGGVRPGGAIEGTLRNDLLAGDSKGKVAEKFFFDTSLDLHLGLDTISNFGANDTIVTTTALYDGNGDGIISFGADKLLDLPGGVGGPGDDIKVMDGGFVSITDIKGDAVVALELDGITNHNGVNYYSYSLVG